MLPDRFRHLRNDDGELVCREHVAMQLASAAEQLAVEKQIVDGRSAAGEEYLELHVEVSNFNGNRRRGVDETPSVFGGGSSADPPLDVLESEAHEERERPLSARRAGLIRMQSTRSAPNVVSVA